MQEADTYMELNIPIKAVKQKPMANMDFIRTCEQKVREIQNNRPTLRNYNLTPLKTGFVQITEINRKKDGPGHRGVVKMTGEIPRRLGAKAATDGKCCCRDTKPKSAQELSCHPAQAGFIFSLSL